MIFLTNLFFFRINLPNNH